MRRNGAEWTLAAATDTTGVPVEDGLRSIVEMDLPIQPIRLRLELGLTLVGAARCLLELGRRDDTDGLVEAHDLLRPLHAAPPLAEIADLLADDLARGRGRELGSTSA